MGGTAFLGDAHERGFGFPQKSGGGREHAEARTEYRHDDRITRKPGSGRRGQRRLEFVRLCREVPDRFVDQG